MMTSHQVQKKARWDIVVMICVLCPLLVAVLFRKQPAIFSAAIACSMLALGAWHIGCLLSALRSGVAYGRYGSQFTKKNQPRSYWLRVGIYTFSASAFLYICARCLLQIDPK